MACQENDCIPRKRVFKKGVEVVKLRFWVTLRILISITYFDFFFFNGYSNISFDFPSMQINDKKNLELIPKKKVTQNQEIKSKKRKKQEKKEKKKEDL